MVYSGVSAWKRKGVFTLVPSENHIRASCSGTVLGHRARAPCSGTVLGHRARAPCSGTKFEYNYKKEQNRDEKISCERERPLIH